MRFGREIIGQRQFLGFLMLLSRCMVTDGVRLLICTNCPICAYTAEEPIMENEVRFETKECARRRLGT